MKLGLVGPMTGYENHNYSLFESVKDRLEGLGYEVFSPTRIQWPTDHETGTRPFWLYFMKRSIAELLTCDGVVRLTGTADSDGAIFECFVCGHLDIPIRKLDYWIDNATRYH